MTVNHHGPVAVVDDDPAVLEALKFLLEVAGYPVGAYSSAMRFLEDRTLQPACLILDQHMPHMTGLELAGKLRTQGIMVPILLISAAVSPAIILRAAQVGIEKVLQKPPLEDDLLSFVGAHYCCPVAEPSCAGASDA